jgi:hypothetical protein
MSCAVSRGSFPEWKGKHVVNSIDLAPPPYSVEDGGRISDAKGQPVAWIAARLNLGDDSWRVIANKLAAAAEMEAALVLYEQSYEALSNWERSKAEKLLSEAREKGAVARAKARGETP